MNRALVILAALLIACCANRPTSQNQELVDQTTAARQEPTQTPTNVKTDGGKETRKPNDEVPPEFRSIDFKNLTYPISYNMAYAADVRRRSVQLKDGSREYPSKFGGGTNYELGDVNYVDLDGDRRKEAVVRLSQLVCGGSCDGGTDIFYFYSINRGRPILLSRLEIGSYAYDCGLKSFVLKNRKLALETFRSCRFTGSGFKSVYNDPDEKGGKFLTNRYTQFQLRFNGRRFVQKNRKVFSYPEDFDYRSYECKTEISNG